MAEININVRGETTAEVLKELQFLLNGSQLNEPSVSRNSGSVPATAAEVREQETTESSGEQTEDKSEAPPAGKTTKKKASKKKAVKKRRDEERQQEEEQQQETSGGDNGNADGEAQPPTLEELRPLAEQVVDATNVGQIKELLTKHGGKNLSTIPEENRAAFKADCEKVIAESGE